MDFSLIEKTLRPNYYCKMQNLKKNTLGVSPQVFFQLLPNLNDDYLTEWEHMKFRSAFSLAILQSFITPCVLFTGFYLASPYYLRLYVNRLNYYRTYRIIMSLSLTSMSYVYINTKAWPNKHFHDLLTQPEPNGKYLRTTFANKFPVNWSNISKELNRQGYDFSEMNEYSNKLVMPDVTNKFDNTMY